MLNAYRHFKKLHPSYDENLLDPLELAQVPSILCASFNQTKTLLSVGTQNGFYVFRLSDSHEKSFFFTSFKTLEKDNVEIKGVGILDIYKESNIVAFVGGGPRRLYDDYTGKGFFFAQTIKTTLVIIWNAATQLEISKIEYNEPITAVTAIGVGNSDIQCVVCRICSCF